MQASGVCCPWAASISSSRALHTEGDTSSGSTKRNTLRAKVGGPGADDEDHGEKGHPQSLAAPATPHPQVIYFLQKQEPQIQNSIGGQH